LGTYLKRFIFVSLIYLGLATIFGILNGITDLGYWGLFAHTHFNLLGFMSMMVFGIGYFILPRFNGADLRFGSWVPVHFWLGNLSLLGMILFRGLEVSTGETPYMVLFVVFASLQVLSIFMFVVNIWLTLASPKPAAAQAPATTPPKPKAVPKKPARRSLVTLESKIGELVDLVPSIKDVLIKAGLQSLSMPGHIEKVKAMGITVGMACTNHGLDVDEIVSQLEQELLQPGSGGLTATSTSEPAATGTGATISTGTLIGEVIASYPTSREVFRKHFGDGCFDCPGQSYESIDMACRMHGVDPDSFLREVNEAVGG